MTGVPTPEEFRRARAEGNDRLRAAVPVAESFFAVDAAAYAAGALPAATKELLGLVVSVVTLRRAVTFMAQLPGLAEQT